jgi:hypothetical protein
VSRRVPSVVQEAGILSRAAKTQVRCGSARLRPQQSCPFVGDSVKDFGIVAGACLMQALCKHCRAWFHASFTCPHLTG